ncbi:MAG: hypothetical protein ACJ72G_05100, partial [Friedmanniella sp.]
MTRYADPHRCPDCRHTIAPHSASCPACGLVLSGETARQLFVTLTRADEQLAALRTLSRPAVATASTPAGQGTPVAQATPARQVTATPARPVRRPAGGLSAASVPKILLTLGAGCLLVAAIVFLAVTWSVLGVGGRTATLVVFTAVAGLLTWWMARRGLRAAAESLGLVGYGLLTLDVVGADNAGWFGDLPVAGLLVLLGATLAASGVAGALLVARSTTVALVGAEVVAAVGTGLAAYGLVEGAWLTPDASALVATMLAAAAGGAAHRFRLVVATAGAAVVAAMAWLSLASLATARALDHATWSGLWLDLHVWPLLAAALLAAGPALLRRLPSPARVSFLAVAELLVVFAAVAPMLEGDPTRLTVVAVALLLVAAVAMVALPRPWGMAVVLTQVVVGASVLAVTLELVQVSAARLMDAGASGWSGRAGDVLPDVTTVGLPAGWLIPFCVLAMTATGWALTRCFTVLRPAASLATDLRLGAAVLVASLVATLAWYPVPLWLVLAALLLSAGCFTAWWRAAGAWGPLVPAAAFLGSGVLVSLHAEGLTLAALVVTVALTGLVHLRAAQPELAAAGGAVLATALGGAVWTAGSLVGAVPAWVALVGLLVLGLVVLAGPYAPRHWWTAAVRLPRIGLETGAGVTALVLGAVGVADAGRV